jgi:Ca2+:H+ antiporter
MMPALFALTPEANSFRTEAVSVGVSIVLIVTYGLALLFALKTHKRFFGDTHGHGEAEAPKWSKGKAMGMLGGATVFVAIMSEFLVGALEPTVEELGISKLFVGLIVVPIVGNAAEPLWTAGPIGWRAFSCWRPTSSWRSLSSSFRRYG